MTILSPIITHEDLTRAEIEWFTSGFEAAADGVESALADVRNRLRTETLTIEEAEALERMVHHLGAAFTAWRAAFPQGRASS